MTPPAGWDYIGDSPSVILPNGHFLIGRKFDMQMAELDPVTMQWTAVGSSGKSDWNAEEGWTLMPDGTVLTADVLTNPELGAIHSFAAGVGLRRQHHCEPAGTARSGLHPIWGRPVLSSGRNRPGYLAAGRHGVRNRRPPPGCFHRTHLGLSSWQSARPIPALGFPDQIFPMAMTPATTSRCCCINGKVLVEGSSSRLYEFDGTNFTPTLYSNGGSLIVLPTSEVLVGGSEVYKATGSYVQPWAPAILSYPSVATRGQSYIVSGKLFNGWSQAAAFGDELETATNYPLVRITNIATGHVFYAKTHDHSYMGVQTGNVPTYTHFDVPAGMETGAESAGGGHQWHSVPALQHNCELASRAIGARCSLARGMHPVLLLLRCRISVAREKSSDQQLQSAMKRIFALRQPAFFAAALDCLRDDWPLLRTAAESLP